MSGVNIRLSNILLLLIFTDSQETQSPQSMMQTMSFDEKVPCVTKAVVAATAAAAAVTLLLLL